MRTVELHTGVGASAALRIAQVRVGGVGGDKGLCLRGDWGEHALLVEALAVGAAAVGRVLKARTANLEDAVSAPTVASSWFRVVSPPFGVPFVDDNTGKQWLFSAAALRPGKPPAVPGAAVVGTPCMGVDAGRPPSWREEGDIVTKLGDSVVVVGIATEAEEDSRRGHALGEEGRRPAGTRRIYQQ